MNNSKSCGLFNLDKGKGYFTCHGVDVMAFDDIYPAGHQSGVSILMHDKRIATNGDLRLEQTPGQWQPLPKQGNRTLDEKENSIVTQLHYPDLDNHLKGFNPMIYPDITLDYKVTVQGEKDCVRVKVELEQPIPEKYAGKVHFIMELFPGELFGKPWIMDDRQGIFPVQPNGPVMAQKSNYPYSQSVMPLDGITADRERLSGNQTGYNPIIADDLVSVPYAAGHVFTLRPDEPLMKCTFRCKENEIRLYDGRMNHNNGWFVLATEVPAGKAGMVVEWEITPNTVPEWIRKPVVQVSQVGYLPAQSKIATVELDARDDTDKPIVLRKITADGYVNVLERKGVLWGRFLRYNYLQLDFSPVTEPGLYQVVCGDNASSVFRIGEDVYDRGVWQPVLEYFLPVQMCHMRVNEKYRVWHGLCHHDDARMAPVNYNHIDGYVQGPSTLTRFKSGDCVPGLNRGGWHDAGDFDLRIESQAGEMYILALAYEEFGVDYDATSIDQEKQITEIHQPDGQNDILQQIEHGALSVVGAYQVLGRLYRGIICNDLRQYVLLGDSAAMTDNLIGNDDDRWVFTEDNPPRELRTAAHLAATARVLKGFNDDLAAQALRAAEELFDVTKCDTVSAQEARVHAACELWLTTTNDKYRACILEQQDMIVDRIGSMGWFVSRVVHTLENQAFTDKIACAMNTLKNEMDKLSAETPYGIPYRPHIWGAGWDIQRLGYEYYFLHKAFPDVFDRKMICSALDFILGCHPGSNTASFASGVGARSATVAYGLNRADFSYIPGGVVSGTALIRPDFPELLIWPYLWQQTEYVLGGGSSHYMFLVLAVIKLLKK